MNDIAGIRQLSENIINSAEPYQALWAAIIALENHAFETTSGLPFTYTVKTTKSGEKGKELQVSRKEKTITRASVERAYDKVAAAGQSFPVKMTTPKELGVFGASYIYPVFICLGLVEHIGSDKRGGRRKQNNICL